MYPGLIGNHISRHTFQAFVICRLCNQILTWMRMRSFLENAKLQTDIQLHIWRQNQYKHLSKNDFFKMDILREI